MSQPENVNYALSDIAMRKTQENALAVLFENDQDDGRNFFTTVIKDRNGEEIYRYWGSDYGMVRSELDSYLTQYEAPSLWHSLMTKAKFKKM